MNLSYDQALAINNLIDRLHSPDYWAIPVSLGLFATLEIFLPAKEDYLSQFDKYFTYIKFTLIVFFMLVATSQGFTGGCVIHIVQNWLAHTYLGQEYWNTPYGIVYREYLPEGYVWVLQLIYFTGGAISLIGAWQYYKKFIRIPAGRIASQEN